MARPHVDFIDSATVTAEAVSEGPFAGSARRLLSADAATGAFSALDTWSAGFSFALGGCASLLELYVVAGEVSAGGAIAPRGGYVRIPAGAAPFLVTAGSTAEVLVLADGPLVAGAETGARQLVVDSAALPWIGEAWEGCLPGFALKALWTDVSAGPSLLIVGNVPHFGSGPEFHECPEELFVLEGDWLGRAGHMTRGSYFWRPELITHGPYFSELGSLCLVRGHGPLVANWIDDPDATPEENRAWIERRRRAAA